MRDIHLYERQYGVTNKAFDKIIVLRNIFVAQSNLIKVKCYDLKKNYIHYYYESVYDLLIMIQIS